MQLFRDFIVETYQANTLRFGGLIFHEVIFQASCYSIIIWLYGGHVLTADIVFFFATEKNNFPSS